MVVRRKEWWSGGGGGGGEEWWSGGLVVVVILSHCHVTLSRHILTYREVAEKRRETGDDQPLDQIYSTPPPAKTAAQGTDDVEHEVCINCTTSLSCH